MSANAPSGFRCFLLFLSVAMVHNPRILGGAEALLATNHFHQELNFSPDLIGKLTEQQWRFRGSPFWIGMQLSNELVLLKPPDELDDVLTVRSRYVVTGDFSFSCRLATAFPIEEAMEAGLRVESKDRVVQIHRNRSEAIGVLECTACESCTDMIDCHYATEILSDDGIIKLSRVSNLLTASVKVETNEVAIHSVTISEPLELVVFARVVRPPVGAIGGAFFSEVIVDSDGIQAIPKERMTIMVKDGLAKIRFPTVFGQRYELKVNSTIGEDGWVDVRQPFYAGGYTLEISQLFQPFGQSFFKLITKTND